MAELGIRSGLRCDRCGQSVTTCTCPGIDEMLFRLAQDPEAGFAAKWCIGCNRYWARCTCVVPEFRLFVSGQQVDPRAVRTATGQTVAETNPEIGIPSPTH